MSRAPLHALPGFVAAARTGNLSRAAEALNLTVSALSHQIRGLEERLGQRLFVRNARGVELTAHGRDLFEQVGPHFDAIEKALQPFRPCRDEVLTVSLTASMASAWLVPRLAKFLAAHPQLEINLQSRATLVNFERERHVDAALRIGQGRWPGVVAEHLFDEWVAPVASPELVARLGRPALKELGRWPLLGDPDGADLWRAWFTRFGGELPSRLVATLDDSEALHRAAAAGVGVALGKLTRVRLLLEAGQLVQLTRQRLRTDYGHYLVYPERSRDHQGLAAFRSWLLEEAALHERAMRRPAGAAARPAAGKPSADDRRPTRQSSPSA